MLRLAGGSSSEFQKRFLAEAERVKERKAKLAAGAESGDHQSTSSAASKSSSNHSAAEGRGLFGRRRRKNKHEAAANVVVPKEIMETSLVDSSVNATHQAVNTNSGRYKTQQLPGRTTASIDTPNPNVKKVDTPKWQVPSQMGTTSPSLKCTAPLRPVKSLPQKAASKAESTMEMIKTTIKSQEDRDDEIEKQRLALLKEAKSKMADGNKRGAVRCMKKVKILALEQSKIASAIDIMEAQIITIDSAINNAKVVAAMQEGNTAMKDIHGRVSVEQMDVVLENVRESFEYADEVREILAQPTDNLVMNEDELLAELEEEMEQEEKGKKTPSQEVDLQLPNAPIYPHPQQENGLKREGLTL